MSINHHFDLQREQTRKEDKKKKKKEEKEARRKHDQEIADRKKAVEERQQLQNQLHKLAHPSSPNHQSTMEKFAHLASLTPEGIMGEVLFNYFKLFVHLTVPISLMIQHSQYRKAYWKEMAAVLNLYCKDADSGKYPDIYPLDDEGNPKWDERPIDRAVRTPTDEEIIANGYLTKLTRFVYMPDENGIYPTVYHTDPNTGQINYERTYNNKEGKAPAYAILANGYMPYPSVSRGLINALNAFREDMYGAAELTAAEKLNIYGTLNPEEMHQQHTDKAADNTALRLQQKPAKPAAPG